MESKQQKIIRFLAAVANGNVKKVQEIAENEREFDIINEIPERSPGVYGLPALDIAIVNKDSNMVDKLLYMGADPNIGYNDNNERKVKMLYTDISDEPFAFPPFFLALDIGTPSIIESLLNEEVNLDYEVNVPTNNYVNFETSQHMTYPLSHAMNIIQEFVVANDDDPETTMNTEELWLPIIVKILDRTINQPNLLSVEMQPVSLAADLELFGIVEQLLMKYSYANPNEVQIDYSYTVDRDKLRNLLMNVIDHAIYTEAYELIQTLLEMGADPNNNIGMEVGFHHIDNNNFQPSPSQEMDLEYLRDSLASYRDDLYLAPDYVNPRFLTALDYANLRFPNNISPQLTDLLREYGAKTTKEIIQDHLQEDATIDYENSDVRRKLLDIPIISNDVYQKCVETMSPHDKQLVDFITGDVISIEDTIVLPSASGNITCMGRDSFSQYVKDLRNDRKPVIHPYTREKLSDIPQYNEWVSIHFPFGIINGYTDALNKVRLKSQGGKKNKVNILYKMRKSQSNVKRTRKMRGKGDPEKNVKRESPSMKMLEKYDKGQPLPDLYKYPLPTGSQLKKTIKKLEKEKRWGGTKKRRRKIKKTTMRRR